MADYNVTDDNCGGGSPRFQIQVDTNGDNVSDGNVHVAIGPSPSFTGCAAGWQSTGNIIGDTDAGRYDYGQFGGSAFTTYAGAPANVLAGTVRNISIVVDGSWSAAASGGDSEQTVLVDNVVINNATYDFTPAPAPTVDVTIIKYVDGVHATEANADSQTFPMQATYDFTNDQFPGGIQGTDPFDIGPTGNNTPEAYEAKTLDFYQGADYGMYERMDTEVVGATCEDGKPFALQGYKVGDTLVDAQNAAASPTAPSFTDMQSDKYVIVMNETCVAPTPDVTVTISKFIDGAMATAVSADNSAFPMEATWNATNIGAGAGAYDLDADGFNGDPTPYQAITAMMTSGADYSTNEVVGGPVVGATCADGKPYALAGYSVGDSFAAAQAAPTTAESPAFTNITTDKYVIVRNVTCDEEPPAPITNACDTPNVAPQGYTLRKGTSKSDSVRLAPNTMFVGKGGADSVTGGPGNYIVCLGSGADSVSLGAGQSVVDAGNGANSITLGNGSGHYVKTGSANDVITTGNGDDTIKAGGGNNSVTTRAGDDNITTGGGNDTVNAGAGTDTCALGGGNNNPTSCEL